MNGIEEKLNTISTLLDAAKVKNYKVSHKKNVSAVKHCRAILMDIIKTAKEGREELLEQRKAHLSADPKSISGL